MSGEVFIFQQDGGQAHTVGLYGRRPAFLPVTLPNVKCRQFLLFSQADSTANLKLCGN